MRIIPGVLAARAEAARRRDLSLDRSSSHKPDSRTDRLSRLSAYRLRHRADGHEPPDLELYSPMLATSA